MLMLFTCEHCGNRIKVDARMQGRRGRCSNCGQVMRIPHVEAAHPPPLPAAAPTHAAVHTADRATAHSPAQPTAHPVVQPHSPESEAPFRLSPPDARPGYEPRHVHQPPILTEPEHLDRHLGGATPSEFELIAEDANPDEAGLTSPAIRRGLRELEEFQTDPRPYRLADDLDNRFFRSARGSGPASWVYAQWRKGVGLILRVLRFIDDWAYLLSVPFLILMIFGAVVAHRGLVHTGAVVVVLTNYGRFWTDLLALFVRPFKEGPVHGLLFFFPPYGIYYLASRRDQFKSTFRRLLTSCIPIALVILAYAFIPSIDPGIQEARTVPEKLRRAEQEVVKEAREGLHEAGEELRSLEKTGVPRAGADR